MPTVKYPRLDLRNSVVAITGAGRGIGRETAIAFARAGATVAIGDLDLDAAQQVAEETGGTAFQLDVTTKDSFAEFLGGARDLGELNVLVNNAGVMPAGSFFDESDAISAASLNVNVWGLIHGMRLALPEMIARGRGHVVNVASLAGKFPTPGLAVYCASKYAAVGLSATVREEIAGTGVSVSTILPSAVRTRLSSGLKLGGGMPTVDPDQVAAAVVKSVSTRRAEIAVPGWVRGLEPVLAATPEPVLQLVRGLMDGNRALRTENAQVRAAYEEAIAAQTKE
ncbi:SDR family oxidoreductase [Pseudonocardiaceae bacterium YIM PH 21723]|nr:SDR family oxidoreductase [Pseudonocardiaceae bacterium YIM PH 21723]